MLFPLTSSFPQPNICFIINKTFHFLKPSAPLWLLLYTKFPDSSSHFSSFNKALLHSYSEKLLMLGFNFKYILKGYWIQWDSDLIKH